MPAQPTAGLTGPNIFRPRSVLTLMFLAAMSAGAPPAQAGSPDLVRTNREATHSARHARRHGEYVGPVTATIHLGRSRPCPCGSGKKYKRCHLSIDVASRLKMSRSQKPTGLRLDAA